MKQRVFGGTSTGYESDILTPAPHPGLFL